MATKLNVNAIPDESIASTKLTAAAQTSLGKADSALQAVPSTYRTSAAQDTIDATKQDKMTTVNMTDLTATLDPGKLYKWSSAISGTLAISFASDYTAVDEFSWEFTTDSTTALTMTYPDTVHWVGNVSGLEKGYTYQCSVMDGIGVIVGLDKSE